VALDRNQEAFKEAKELLEKVKTEKKITMELLMKLKPIAEKAKVPIQVNESTVKRETKSVEVEAKQFRQHNYGRDRRDTRPNRDHNRNKGGEGEFAKGTQRQPKPEEVISRMDQGIQRQAVDENKKLLQQKAKDTRSKLDSTQKTRDMEIRSIMNVIAPDNYEKKHNEICAIIFGEKDANGKVQIDQTVLRIVVDIIFKKAQMEKDYCQLYGDLCERLTRQELITMGTTKITRTALKKSNFRYELLGYCRESFNKFFLSKEQIEAMDEEAHFKFKNKLLCNIKFVGELFKRQLIN